MRWQALLWELNRRMMEAPRGSLPSLPPLGGSTRSLPSLGSSRLSLDDDGGDAPLPPPSRRRVLELPRLEERPVAFSWWAFTNPSPAARAEAPAVHTSR